MLLDMECGAFQKIIGNQMNTLTIYSFGSPYVFQILWPEFGILIFWLGLGFLFFESLRQIIMNLLFPLCKNRCKRRRNNAWTELDPFITNGSANGSVRDVWSDTM